MNIQLDTHQHDWNRFVSEQSGHILQRWEYGAVRQNMQTEILHLAFYEGGKIQAVIQMSLHPIPYLPWKVGYIPRGPVVRKNFSEDAWLELFKALTQIAKSQNLAFIKIEPNITAHTDEQAVWSQIIQKLSIPAAQNPRFMNATSMIDLTQSEETLLQNCRKNTRYYIRKAPRENIIYEEATNPEDLKDFYSLLSETADRQNFQLGARPVTYFESLWTQFRKKDQNDCNLRLFFAKIGTERVATVLNFYDQNTAYYPYGASSSKARGTAATEGLMWHAISEAKKSGLKMYDLWGILPTENKEHPYWGYTFFKQGFGGKTVEYVGSYDFPIISFAYTPLQYLEKLRRSLLKIKPH
ncbi:peptidoglycan bridge formation glycyltransferase FemA/FemB family protein [candidate division WWE3 bacterium]|uniref:Peptidoglycan bridge formation glycyltransferase FemA/FemB family protein n=1 Tax=candidate division WWE3 bacterium TaxID=2053526 RepID=A0A955LGN0_UNCKA|nr:peptidoglycan bridge formation glycyltransferase FemA/FemB family protein [candidate division WWE3 bacterium]